MKFPVTLASLLALLSSLGCDNRGTSECATPLTYVTTPFTSGEHAIHHASEYRMNLFMGSDDFMVSARLDTGSAGLVVNNTNFAFGTQTLTGTEPFIYSADSNKAPAINAKDDVDVGCLNNFATHFMLTSNNAKVDNTVGLAYGDKATLPHEKNRRAFFDQLVEDEGFNDVFSLALCRDHGSSRVLLGGIDSVMQPYIGNYIPVIERSLFVVPALTLRLADNKKMLGEFPSYNVDDKQGVRTVIDSGSAFLLLPEDMAASVARELMAQAQSLNLLSKFPEGFFATERGATTKLVRFASQAQIRQFSSLEIGFRGVDKATKNLSIPPQHYFKEVSSDPLLRAFAVRASSGDVVLGQPFLESHYTVFDRKNGRIGFGNIDLACAQ